jgi:hypothetical protein
MSTFSDNFNFLNDAQFLMPLCYGYSQNTIISFEYVDFWPRIYLNLYPYLGNLITHIAIKVSVVLGSQWGDEGKGKLVDLLAEHADVVARCQVSTHYFI